LYNALSVQTIELTPLRDRRADLPALVEHFLARVQEDDGKAVTLSAAAMECLQAYAWPANLRELLAVLSSARRHASGSQIDLPDLSNALRLTTGVGRPGTED